MADFAGNRRLSAAMGWQDAGTALSSGHTGRGRPRHTLTTVGGKEW